MSDYAVFVEGLSSLTDLEKLPENVKKKAQQAVNGILRRARPESAKRIARLVNLPASYMSDSSGRLSITQYATSNKLEGVITGRQRATSLARFSSGGTVNKPGVSVAVKPGASRLMKKAFLVRLKAGSAPIETRSNLGLAVRLKKGTPLRNKTKMARLGKGLYLLYGPSVDQVFKQVSADMQPVALDWLEDEFLRLMEF